MRDSERESVEDRRMRRLGEFVEGLGEGAGVRGYEGFQLTGLTVRLPTEEDPSTLLVVKASTGEGHVVGFVGAYKVGDAMLAWRAKVQAGTMKWREDVPWKERGRGKLPEG